MAIDKNLIQVQSDIQDPAIEDKDLIKYANGANPEVPPFLALMEMSRRKQIKDSSQNFDASNQKSIKDQLASALTAPTQTKGGLGALPAGQVNPAAAPPGVNMAAAPQGVNPAMPPQQVDPTAMPQQPQMAAGGGLMSLPVDHFNANSYAGGGIVAFAGGGAAQDQWMQEPGGLNVLKEEAEPAPGSYQGILSSLPTVQPISMPAPKNLTPEEAYAGIKKSQALAGVEADPFADVRARQDKLEERQMKAYEQGGLDRLLHQLNAFAMADPAKGFAYAGAVSAEASQVLEKEQQALRDKQEAAQIEFRRGMAKEEDAKKRNDAAGIQAAVEAQKKAQQEYVKLEQQQQKLEIDRENIAAHLYGTQETATTQREANKENAAYHKAVLGKPTHDEFMAKLAETKPDLFRLMQGQGKAGVLTFEEALKVVNADKLNMGKSADEKIRMAQELLDAQERLRKSGNATNPTAKPPVEAGFDWSSLVPSWMGSSSKSEPPADVQKILDKYK